MRFSMHLSDLNLDVSNLPMPVRYTILGSILIAFGLLVWGIVYLILRCFAKEEKPEKKKKKGDGATSKKKKKKSADGKGDVEKGSESSSLLEEGRQLRSDLALMDTFVKVLSQGIVVKLHTAKGPKDVKLTLIQSGDKSKELRWQSTAPRTIMGGKRYKLDLVEVKFVEWGKKTSNFSRATSVSTSEDLCFSLVTEKTSLDIEVSSKVERDSFAQGFTILIKNFDRSAKGAVDSPV